WLKRNRAGLSLEEFAAGVIRVVNANMEKAVRVVSIERGHDPRPFTLVAFCCACSMHACDLAASLRIPRVLVPSYPAALSALRIMISDWVKDHTRTVLPRGKRPPYHKVEKIFTGLRLTVDGEVKREDWKGSAVYEPSVDLRYRGQGY